MGYKLLVPLFINHFGSLNLCATVVDNLICGKLCRTVVWKLNIGNTVSLGFCEKSWSAGCEIVSELEAVMNVMCGLKVTTRELLTRNCGGIMN